MEISLMTGNQGLGVLLVGPLLGVLVARLIGQTRLLPILAGALLGEGIAYVAVVMWSRRLLQSALAAPPDKVVGFATINVSFADRLTALGFLAVAALVIGALAFLVLRAFRGLA
jgi:hypothetical protein